MQGIAHRFSGKWNESLTVYLLLVKGFDVGTKTITRVYVVFCSKNKIALNWGQPSASCLCNLQRPYIVPDLVSTDFIDCAFLLTSDRINQVLKNGV